MSTTNGTIQLAFLKITSTANSMKKGKEKRNLTTCSLGKKQRMKKMASRSPLEAETTESATRTQPVEGESNTDKNQG